MIDIIDQMITLTKGVPEFDGRVYRYYPQSNDDDGKPYATITRGSRIPVLIGEGGKEVITALSYHVNIFAGSPTSCDDILYHLVDLYKSRRIICTGISSGYSSGRMYYITATFGVTVDIRGNPFTG